MKGSNAKIYKAPKENNRKSAKVGTGHFQGATEATALPHRTAGSVSSTEHTSAVLKSKFIPAIYSIKPKITLLHTHK